jgi:hypothetical protein
MGLDTVELVMEVEESFGITIPDGRACQMRTVGDLDAFILEETRDTAGWEHAFLTLQGNARESLASWRSDRNVDAMSGRTFDSAARLAIFLGLASPWQRLRGTRRQCAL